jgi:hypothetical protein
MMMLAVNLSLPALAAAGQGNDIEGLLFLAGTIITILVGAAIMQYCYYEPIRKKIEAMKYRDRPDDLVQNELDYANYLIWAAQNGYTPLVSKKTINTNSVNNH